MRDKLSSQIRLAYSCDFRSRAGRQAGVRLKTRLKILLENGDDIRNTFLLGRATTLARLDSYLAL